MRALALAALLLLPAACGRPSAAPAVSWTASRDGRVVLRFSKGPAPLTAPVSLPPGAARPPEKPFVNVTAVDPAAADDLRGILDRSQTLDQFLGNLRSAGYQVTEEKPAR